MRWYLSEYGPTCQHKDAWYTFDDDKQRAVKLAQPPSMKRPSSRKALAYSKKADSIATFIKRGEK